MQREYVFSIERPIPVAPRLAVAGRIHLVEGIPYMVKSILGKGLSLIEYGYDCMTISVNVRFIT
jgi:hypothetical protein